MKVVAGELPGTLILEPRVFRDERGSFLETWSERRYAEAGIPGPFVQDNVSVSRRGVLRGLHFQDPHPQAKLVTVLAGEVWDVAVDLRRDSPGFGRWMGLTLDAESGRQFFIPAGFAHGFQVLSDEAVVSYRCSEYYHPEAEGTLAWDDPDLAIDWPVSDPVLSGKDRRGRRLQEIADGRSSRR
ncbi:MAG TPA: dTDP-4-dehydrorhamnose 3,5-epimerase [Longimicrobiaceae bacterium]|nr:dTDP-4-dehydrorhamnose 3,5-epimerase [Longimicrobiaceae bacterium]